MYLQYSLHAIVLSLAESWSSTVCQQYEIQSIILFLCGVEVPHQMLRSAVIPSRYTPPFFIVQRLCIIGPVITDVTVFTTLPGCHLLLQSDSGCILIAISAAFYVSRGKILLVRSNRGFLLCSTFFSSCVAYFTN